MLSLPHAFEPRWTPPEGSPPGGYWFVWHANKLLVASCEPGVGVIPRGRGDDLPVPVGEPRCVGVLAGAPCWAVETANAEAPPGFAFEAWRRLFARVPDELLAVAGRAAQVVEFHRCHTYCGACGTPTEIHDNGRARRCPRCGEVVYPRIAPAMMVLIKRDTAAGRELLLARGARFPGAFYSALAGFVEPSESVEQCVHRETLEEVGLRLRNLRYHGSQSWPLPHSLMLGFVADYASGEITCQEGEIVDARWFSLADLPQLPHRLSLARQLINDTLAEVAPNHPALDA